MESFVSILHSEQLLCYRECLVDTFVSLSKEHNMLKNRTLTSVGTDYFCNSDFYHYTGAVALEL